MQLCYKKCVLYMYGNRYDWIFIVLDRHHTYTIINMDDLNVFDQKENGCQSYF